MNYLLLLSPAQAGAYAKEQRMLQGLTQKELEFKCTFSSGFIGKLERGELWRISVPDANELEFVLKKFKRKNFEALGKCVLQITEVKSDESSRPERNKTEPVSTSAVVDERSQSRSGTYRIDKPTIERVSSNQVKHHSSNSSEPSSARAAKESPMVIKENGWSLSMIFEALWRVAVFIGVLLVIGNWIFGDNGNEVVTPNPVITYEQPQVYIPDVTQPANCAFNDGNCDGIDDSRRGQPGWNPGWDYDGDGIPNINDTDVNGDGSPNGWDEFSDPFEVGGLSNWGCPFGQPSC